LIARTSKHFAALLIMLKILTKLFSDLYLAKFLDFRVTLPNVRTNIEEELEILLSL